MGRLRTVMPDRERERERDVYRFVLQYIKVTNFNVN